MPKLASERLQIWVGDEMNAKIGKGEVANVGGRFCTWTEK